MLSLTSIVAVGQVEYNYRYWFDGREDMVHTGMSTSNKWTINADVSELDVGFHTLYLQVDTSGVQSPALMKYFIKPLNNNVTTRYWFDSDYENSKELNGSIVDVSHLREGFHSISFQANDNGIASGVKSSWFIKVVNPTTSGDMTCVCLIDGVEYAKEKVAAKGGILKLDFDVKSLSQGLHKIQIFCVTPMGVMTNIKESLFLRATTSDEVQSMRCYYAIDGSTENGYLQVGTYSDGMFHFDLDVASLSDGLHSLTYLLVSETGIATRAQTSFFLKTPLGGNAITKWEYWTNGNDSLKHTAMLEVPKNPLQLISLLPVESSPIRSTSFEFRVEDKKPVLYAKNDINLRFYDKAGRITDVSKQYVDENVSQELKVDEIAVLKSNVATRVNRPAENEIKWYKFDAEEGELAEFYSNKACSIDVFTPSGDTFYSVSGAESVKTGGGNLPETGTYYVAIHDMTAKTGTYLNLTFNLIDKYAVLSQNVKKVGNGGISTITFNGNGYLYLDSISIDNGNTIIKDFDIKYKSNTEIEATFDFTGAEQGKYDITLHFVDDKLVLSNALTVETAKAITLVSNVTFDAQYTFGLDSEYKVIIKNDGNMTAYKVPVYVYVETPLTDRIPPIKMKGFDLSGVLDGIDLSEFSQNDINYLQEKVAKLGDGLHFNKFRTINEETGDSILVQSNYFFVEIPPYTTKTYTIAINSDQAISCYVTTPEEWVALRVTEGGVSRNNIRTLNYASDWYCCYKERIECVLTVAGNISGLVNMCVPEGTPASVISDVISCATSTLGYVSTFAGTAMCNKDEVEKNLYDKTMVASNSISAVDYIKDCLLKKIKDKFSFKKISAIWNIISKLNDYTLQHVDTNISCITAFTEKKPNCPPTEPKGGTSTPARPCEPNEMHGYTSESGSKFINGNVIDVFYSIESENDPEIATAAAHTIIVTDTIDGRYHDLSTFAATKVKLGDVEMVLNGEKEFVKTMDLRPRIDVIAQVELKYDENSGIAQWTVTSLDPMTMEPTQDVMQGALPVNDSEGNGIGFFDYDIKLKTGLPDGTEIMNRASIIFDIEEPIITPYWVNTVDTECPVSKIDTIECVSDTIVTLRFSGEDNRSGIWRYALYVQPGDGSDWFLAKENIEADSCDYKVYPDINYGFCVVATDSAGNVEPKLLKREISYTGFTKGDANGDGVIDAQDVVLAISKYLGEEPKINFIATDVVRDGVIDAQDVVGIQNLYLHSNVNLYSVKRQRRTIKNE